MWTEHGLEKYIIMKYKYEFEATDGFQKGYCHSCPFAYDEEHSDGYDACCVLMTPYDECPLVEVEED